MWTRNLREMPEITHEMVEEHLVSSESSVDNQPKGASRHKKLGYQLFKSGYVDGIVVKSNVQMGQASFFLVRGKVNAKMAKEEYSVYVHLDNSSGKIVKSNCCCKAGKGGSCKHVAALLFQLLDYKQLELTEVPMELSCTEKLMSWNVPAMHPEKRGPVLFEDLIFHQADYEKDRLGGRKRPIVKGNREGYIAAPAFAEKVTEPDLKRLRDTLDSDTPLAALLDDDKCEPFDYETYLKNLPSRVKLQNKTKSVQNLNTLSVREEILKRLDETSDENNLSTEQVTLVNNKVKASITEILEIERNTRGQADCPEWFKHREIRLTSSNFGSIINRRESVYPKSLLDKIKSNSTTKRMPLSCKWGKENEQNALLKYFEAKEAKVEVCECIGLVVSPKWPWLAASPDALAKSSDEHSNYGAVEIKCPSSKINMSIRDACQDKNFCLSDLDGHISLKRKHQYFYQLQGIMAVCQLQWIDFVVYTVIDLHIERVYFDSQNWKNGMLPKLTNFFFDYLC